MDRDGRAGIVIDAVRCCKLGLDRGLSGTLEGPSAYFMKSPPRQVSDTRAHELTEEFIAGVPGTAAGGNGRALTGTARTRETEAAPPTSAN